MSDLKNFGDFLVLGGGYPHENVLGGAGGTATGGILSIMQLSDPIINAPLPPESDGSDPESLENLLEKVKSEKDSWFTFSEKEKNIVLDEVKKFFQEKFPEINKDEIVKIIDSYSNQNAILSNLGLDIRQDLVNLYIREKNKEQDNEGEMMFPSVLWNLKRDVDKFNVYAMDNEKLDNWLKRKSDEGKIFFSVHDLVEHYEAHIRIENYFCEYLRPYTNGAYDAIVEESYKYGEDEIELLKNLDQIESYYRCSAFSVDGARDFDGNPIYYLSLSNDEWVSVVVNCMERWSYENVKQGGFSKFLVKKLKEKVDENKKMKMGRQEFDKQKDGFGSGRKRRKKEEKNPENLGNFLGIKMQEEDVEIFKNMDSNQSKGCELLKLFFSNIFSKENADEINEKIDDIKNILNSKNQDWKYYAAVRTYQSLVEMFKNGKDYAVPGDIINVFNDYAKIQMYLEGYRDKDFNKYSLFKSSSSKSRGGSQEEGSIYMDVGSWKFPSLVASYHGTVASIVKEMEYLIFANGSNVFDEPCKKYILAICNPKGYMRIMEYLKYGLTIEEIQEVVKNYFKSLDGSQSLRDGKQVEIASGKNSMYGIYPGILKALNKEVEKKTGEKIDLPSTDVLDHERREQILPST